MKTANLLISSGLFLSTLLMTTAVRAGACKPDEGIVSGSLDITNYISNPKNNYAGYTKSLDVSTTVPIKHVTCSCEGFNSSKTLWDWAQFNVPTTTVGDSVYGLITDYLGFAVSPRKGFWAPYADQKSPTTENVCQASKWIRTGGGANSLKILIRKRFVGMVNIPRTLLYTKGTNTAKGDVFREPEIQFYISGQVTVPQSCELNANQVVTMNFGNIGASAFPQAGAGNRPAGVNPQTRSIAIKCNNIDAQAMLSLRVEANNVSGNAIVSDNPDLGFVIADGKQKPLSPNTADSKIPFKLDDAASAVVPISAWPVSVTGKKPKEGKFTSEGYLRVDFD